MRQREEVVVTVAAFDGLQGGVNFLQERWFIYAERTNVPQTHVCFPSCLHLLPLPPPPPQFPSAARASVWLAEIRLSETGDAQRGGA